jgi:ATP-dependent exoDNAse (exonuclease V) alpha subunit
LLDFDSISDIIVTDEYNQVIKAIQNGDKLIFVSGAGGTGKSTLITILKHKFGEIPVVAFTGVAALNVGGQTINSFFQFPFGILNKADILEHRGNNKMKHLKYLIIDEVSMIRADMMDNIDASLKVNKRNNLPFGGVTLIMIGDLYQLSPILKQSDREYMNAKYHSPFFFASESVRSSEMTVIELTEVFRQTDKGFVDLLSNIRTGKDIKKTIDILNTRVTTADKQAITVTPINVVADDINIKELKKIKSAEFVYHGEIVGNFPFKDDRLPAPLDLVLKVGARVMFTRNAGSLYVNGTVGEVTYLDAKKIIVMLDNGIAVDVDKAEWDSYKYTTVRKYNEETKDYYLEVEKTVVASYTQYPLTLAYAKTIHKSQGMTFSKININLTANIFENGQLYVALSRCRSIEGIHLSHPIKQSDVRVNPDVAEFFEHLNNTEESD